MNIMVVDSQGILSDKQASDARNRLYFTLARFEHRINGATMHFSLDESCERVNCSVNVNVEGTGIVSVQRSSVSSDGVLNLAVDSIEPKVACCVDWRSWYNAETLSTWLLSVTQPLKWLLGNEKSKPDSLRRSAIQQPESTAKSIGGRPVASRLLNGPHFSMNSSRNRTFSKN